MFILTHSPTPVSYTHLAVGKRAEGKMLHISIIKHIRFLFIPCIPFVERTNEPHHGAHVRLRMRELLLCPLQKDVYKRQTNLLT